MSCYCYTCKKSFHSLGIARHRAMHRDKKEDCRIAYGDGYIYTHEYAVIEATGHSSAASVEIFSTAE